MFLRNYDNYFAGAHLYSSGIGSYAYGQTSEFTDGYINQKATNSAISTVNYVSSSYKNRYLYPPLNFSAAGICLGDGSEAVTYEDYRLSGNAVANKLVAKSTNTYYQSENKLRIRELICTYYNDTDTEIIINEWGLFRGNPGESSMSYSNDSASVVLVYREVLDTPIVITPGETATISFVLTIPTYSQ